jgi:hypothetical protein
VNSLTARRPAQSKTPLQLWIAWLPAEKRGLFEAVRTQLDISYNILSVALNETIALRAQGSFLQAREGIGLTADLFDRLGTQLRMVLRTVHEQTRNMSALPNVTPLNRENFQSSIGTRIARTNNILSHILLSSRTRFFHKLHSLSELAEDLAYEFRQSAEEADGGLSVAPTLDWDALGTLHLDMNICLLETVIVLKSFLQLLPDNALRAFHHKLLDESKCPVGTSATGFASFSP